MASILELNAEGKLRLADDLGDSPFTVITGHHLRRNTCRAWALYNEDGVRAAVVQQDELKAEPTAFGHSAPLIRDLLDHAEGWTCVNLDVNVASDLAKLLPGTGGESARLYGDLYFTLDRPPVRFAHPFVRPLALEDAGPIDTAPPDLRGAGFSSIEEMLRTGFVAGAVVDNSLAAIAHVSALTDTRAEIGVATHRDHRKQGLSTAAASLAVGQVIESGRVANWSCGEDNLASLRVAEKLGFEAYGRMAYVIPDRS